MGDWCCVIVSINRARRLPGTELACLRLTARKGHAVNGREQLSTRVRNRRYRKATQTSHRSCGDGAVEYRMGEGHDRCSTIRLGIPSVFGFRLARSRSQQEVYDDDGKFIHAR